MDRIFVDFSKIEHLADVLAVRHQADAVTSEDGRARVPRPRHGGVGDLDLLFKNPRDVHFDLGVDWLSSVGHCFNFLIDK